MTKKSRRLEKQAYYKKNRAKRIAYAKKYQREHPGQAKAYGEKWRSGHKEKLSQLGKIKRRKKKAEKKQFIASWFQTHPYEYQIHRLEQVLKKIILKRKQQARWRKYTRLYRARKRGALCNLAADEMLELLAAGCFLCGSMEDLAVAHDIPTSKNGNTTRGNCFCLCRSCNSKMGNKNLAEVLVQKSLLT